jgi:hypothetical protein
MSCETSAGTGKSYGLERVCRVLEFPRSTIYAGVLDRTEDGRIVFPYEAVKV